MFQPYLLVISWKSPDNGAVVSHFPSKALVVLYLSAFRDRGSLGRRVKYRCMPQPRWVGARRSERGRWKSRGLRVCSAPRSGALAVGGYKRPRGRESEQPHASACSVPFPARPTLSKRALVLPFIGVRRGSRCTMGGVAEC
jgi:hypothetical protein